MKHGQFVSKRKILKGILFFLGLVICSYPLLSSIVEQQHLKDAVATYQKQIEEYDDLEKKEAMSQAEKYNRMLYQSEGKIIDTSFANVLCSESYQSILNLDGNGVMGSIEIPKINVNLPIYHGTSNDVLGAGVGHMEGSSFPVGGENTRTVLAGHRGLPNSKLFTRLDELERGDFFFIKVLDEVLAYEVIDIEVIEPEDISKLEIIPEKDLATLLTCTPYGLNTHRLIVTGERVDYDEVTYQSIKKEMMSFRELFFAGLPFMLAAIGIGKVIRNRKWKGDLKRRGERRLRS